MRWCVSATVAKSGGLAVAAVTPTGVGTFHHLDATVMILVWNLGTAASYHCDRLPVWTSNARVGRDAICLIAPWINLRQGWVATPCLPMLVIDS